MKFNIFNQNGVCKRRKPLDFSAKINQSFTFVDCSFRYCYNIRMHLGIDELPNPTTLGGDLKEKHGHCLEGVENRTKTLT